MVNVQCNCFFLYIYTSSIVSIVLSIRQAFNHNVSLNLMNSFVTFLNCFDKVLVQSTQKSRTTQLLEHLRSLIRLVKKSSEIINFTKIIRDYRL